MKKILFITSLCIAISAFFNYAQASATNANSMPKAPVISNTLKPIITKYREGNYIGSMQDLEELVKVEKNNIYAKYYLALCYTRLGYQEEAKILYNEIIKKNENLSLSYYSQRAINCLDNPNSTMCSSAKGENQNGKEVEKLTEMDHFIRSGKQFHPTAMDRITKERMDRKMQEEEYKRSQQEQAGFNTQLKSQAPTNEEIAQALNTLSKIGMNPYTQFNPLAQAPQMPQFNNMNSNANMYNTFMHNSNPDVARMFLYNQMNQQNNMLNYGI